MVFVRVRDSNLKSERCLPEPHFIEDDASLQEQRFDPRVKVVTGSTPGQVSSGATSRKPCSVMREVSTGDGVAGAQEGRSTLGS
eukprot:3940651-Rhodomonas_salina.3